MDELLTEVNGTGRKSKRNFEDYNIKKVVLDNEKNFRDLLMMMVNGDISQYKELKKLSIQDFLIKFEYFCKQLLRDKPKK